MGGEGCCKKSDCSSDYTVSGAEFYLWFVSPFTELIDHISPAWPGLTVMLSACWQRGSSL